MDQPKEEIFHSLSSTNERLMREMADYLEAITQSPGEETAASSATRKADNTSSVADGSIPARLNVPPMPPSADGHVVADDAKKKTRSGGGNNLVPIDENGGDGNSPSSGQYEYFNDFEPDSLQYEDDSLVIMAKRMDNASIVSDLSDPSLAWEKKERMLALPGLKMLTGQKKKPPTPPPPPPRSVRVDRPPPQRLQQQQQQHQVRPQIAELPASASPKPSEGSPSSCKENIECVPGNGLLLTNGKKVESLPPPEPAAGSLNHDSGEQPLIPQADAVKASTSKGRRNSSSEERRKSRRHSGKKGRKPRKEGNGEGGDDDASPNYMPAAYSAEEGKAKKKSRRRSGSKKRKKGRKKRPQRRDNDASDDETMQGVGFNTRIRDKPTKQGAPERLTDRPREVRPERSERRKSHEQVTSEQSAPERLVDRPREVPPERSERRKAHGETTAERHGPTTAAEGHSDRSDSSGSDNENNSVYDSDDQTQIFYESTDDSDFTDSDEEPFAVGTSVADAVRDLNNRTAVSRVKNLFGMR